MQINQINQILHSIFNFLKQMQIYGKFFHEFINFLMTSWESHLKHVSLKNEFEYMKNLSKFAEICSW